MQVNMLIIPDMVVLDIAGPYEMLARVPNWNVDLVAKDMTPVRTDKGFTIVPDIDRNNAKPSDILVIPGGAGIDAAMSDSKWLEFTRIHAERAKWVFGICTGAFMLGAAGLLKGKRAGAHWQARDLLSAFGAIPSNDRIVVDGKYYTSGGVTSGIDAALKVIADIEGQRLAEKIQLAVEYDPAPPFPGGTPFTSKPDIVDEVLRTTQPRRKEREEQVANAVSFLNTENSTLEKNMIIMTSGLL